MQPSWEQREADQNAEDEARLAMLGQLESLRQDWAEYESGRAGLPNTQFDNMFDGRPGLDGADRPLVYLWLIGGAVLLVCTLLGFLLHHTGGH